MANIISRVGIAYNHGFDTPNATISAVVNTDDTINPNPTFLRPALSPNKATEDNGMTYISIRSRSGGA